MPKNTHFGMKHLQIHLQTIIYQKVFQIFHIYQTLLTSIKTI